MAERCNDEQERQNIGDKQRQWTGASRRQDIAMQHSVYYIFVIHKCVVNYCYYVKLFPVIDCDTNCKINVFDLI